MVQKIQNGIRVDVEKFYIALKKEINAYLYKLINGNVNLRKKFIKKMDFIANK